MMADGRFEAFGAQDAKHRAEMGATVELKGGAYVTSPNGRGIGTVVGRHTDTLKWRVSWPDGSRTDHGETELKVQQQREAHAKDIRLKPRAEALRGLIKGFHNVEPVLDARYLVKGWLDTERREAGAELETRSGTEWAAMMAGFELRQVALNLDEGRALDGKTAEIVQELRSAGGFRGIPVPWQALEQRAGETVAGGVPSPVATMPIIDRLFPDSVASRMGAQMISIAQGSVSWPVTTSAVSAGWAASHSFRTRSASS